MIAAQKGHKEAVEALLEHEKGMSDSQSHDALYHALRSGHTEAAKIVIPHEDPTMIYSTHRLLPVLCCWAPRLRGGPKSHE